MTLLERLRAQSPPSPTSQSPPDPRKSWHKVLNTYHTHVATIKRIRHGYPRTNDYGDPCWTVYETILIRPESERSKDVSISGPAYTALCDALGWHNTEPMPE